MISQLCIFTALKKINVKLNNLIWLNYKTVKTFYKRSFENLDEPFPRIHPN